MRKINVIDVKDKDVFFDYDPLGHIRSISISDNFNFLKELEDIGCTSRIKRRLQSNGLTEIEYISIWDDSEIILFMGTSDFNKITDILNIEREYTDGVWGEAYIPNHGECCVMNLHKLKENMKK